MPYLLRETRSEGDSNPRGGSPYQPHFQTVRAACTKGHGRASRIRNRWATGIVGQARAPALGLRWVWAKGPIGTGGARENVSSSRSPLETACLSTPVWRSRLCIEALVSQRVVSSALRRCRVQVPKGTSLGIPLRIVKLNPLELTRPLALMPSASAQPNG
jgi:hypothetical protein